MRAIIDSDVLIDYLQGHEEAKIELGRYSKRETSIISWMEILAGADTPEDDKACRDFLSTFAIHPLSVEIADEAVKIRKSFRAGLPDAIVWATARSEGCLLVTLNSKDFPPTEPGVRIPYEL
ncbi:MAG TPA: type II toxin-antitoxin system VapC family toxin [Opitutaceae bacterium]